MSRKATVKAISSRDGFLQVTFETERYVDGLTVYQDVEVGFMDTLEFRSAFEVGALVEVDMPEPT